MLKMNRRLLCRNSTVDGQYILTMSRFKNIYFQARGTSAPVTSRVVVTTANGVFPQQLIQFPAFAVKSDPRKPRLINH